MIKAARVVLICLHAAALLLLCGCSSPRPVLYPNKYYQQVGGEQATLDIDAAIKAADERNMTHSNDGKEAVKTSVSSGVSAGTVVGAGAAAGGASAAEPRFRQRERARPGWCIGCSAAASRTRCFAVLSKPG